MKLETINRKLGIVAVDGFSNFNSVQIEQMKQVMPKETDISEVAFFYMPNQDLIVVNRNHELYGLITEVITNYIELDEERRINAYAVADGTVKHTLDILNRIIKMRNIKNGQLGVYINGNKN